MKAYNREGEVSAGINSTAVQVWDPKSKACASWSPIESWESQEAQKPLAWTSLWQTTGDTVKMEESKDKTNAQNIGLWSLNNDMDTWTFNDTHTLSKK